MIEGSGKIEIFNVSATIRRIAATQGGPLLPRRHSLGLCKAKSPVGGEQVSGKHREKADAIIFWAMLGVIAGWYTGKIMLSQGYEQLMTVLVGLAAGTGGGLLFDATPLHSEGKRIYSSLAAVMSSIVFSALYTIRPFTREVDRF